MKPSGSTSTVYKSIRGALQRVLLIAAVILGPLGSHTVSAQQQENADGSNQQTRAVSERQALEIVRSRFPGNIISINEVRQGDRVRFRVRIDNEGNIYTVYVDQATGAVSRE
ncbi:hypothetical protein E3V39_13210 [Gammaproteobacteria bacterium LSUCC0112]|nr:hypothetical protein E3V39_13210 [Gammaproteobacteria bacterium LSUCC0112]